jgi:HK97 family phage prohead protease
LARCAKTKMLGEEVGEYDTTSIAQGTLDLKGRLVTGLELLWRDSNPTQVSIGYDSIKSDHKDGVRYLRELKLFEVSLVSLPMNEMATVQTVKGNGNLDAHIRRLTEQIRHAREEVWR